LLYVDSSVFIYPVIYDEAAVMEAKSCKSFLLKIAFKEVDAYTSLITWDEVAWAVRKVLGVEASLSQARKLLKFPNLKFLGVRKTTISKAQEIMERYGLKPRDAIHAATAMENRITIIVSYDKDFDRIRELKRVEP
jgi:predicted nucleic acid-binding protein